MKTVQLVEMGRRIHHLRKKMNLNQSQLGDLTGYSHSAISKIENGEFNLPVSRVKKFADVFGVDVNYLLAEDVKKTPPINDREYACKLINEMSDKDFKTVYDYIVYIDNMAKK